MYVNFFLSSLPHTPDDSKIAKHIAYFAIKIETIIFPFFFVCYASVIMIMMICFVNIMEIELIYTHISLMCVRGASAREWERKNDLCFIFGKRKAKVKRISLSLIHSPLWPVWIVLFYFLRAKMRHTPYIYVHHTYDRIYIPFLMGSWSEAKGEKAGEKDRCRSKDEEEIQDDSGIEKEMSFENESENRKGKKRKKRKILSFIPSRAGRPRECFYV